MTTPTTDSGTPAGSANQLQRVLKARHLTMIALGGAIGTGLFIASGAAIAEAGPGGALLVYLVIGLMVYFIMTSLGELATFMPVSGSFCTYASRYVDPGFGFALGWTFWFSWATVVAVDVVAAQLVMAYWFPDSPGWIWSVAFLALTFGLNAFGARLRRIRILVRADQGHRRAVLHRRGPGHAGRHHPQRRPDRPGQLERGRRALRRQLRHLGGRGHGGGLFVPGHRAGRRGRRRIRKPAPQRAARHQPRVLAHPAVLRAGHPDHRPAHSLYRSATAAQRGRRHRRQPVHAGVPARRPAVGGDGHERGHPDLGAVGRQLRHVRRHAHAVQHGRGRPGARLLQAPDARRRAAARCWPPPCWPACACSAWSTAPRRSISGC